MRVLVTGAASGLGAALVRGFSARGDQVLATDLADSDALPESVAFQRLDVRSTADWDAARERTATEFGGLDILVNNAGIAGGGRIDRTDADEWRRLFDINVLGVAIGCGAFTPVFKRQGSGHIVNIASLAGLVHPAGMSAYAATKAAVVGLSESLRHELRPWGVDVSAVCPSFFRTNLAASLNDADPLMASISAKLITKSPLDADDMAHRVLDGVAHRVFLILPDAPAQKAYWTKRLDPRAYDQEMFDAGERIRAAESR
ncbi:MAG: SDR family NAD(P)-dependent oxidoreductase [Candidatus Nanopelagicales bacterium]